MTTAAATAPRPVATPKKDPSELLELSVVATAGAAQPTSGSTPAPGAAVLVDVYMGRTTQVGNVRLGLGVYLGGAPIGVSVPKRTSTAKPQPQQRGDLVLVPINEPQNAAIIESCGGGGVAGFLRHKRVGLTVSVGIEQCINGDPQTNEVGIPWRITPRAAFDVNLSSNGAIRLQGGVGLPPGQGGTQFGDTGNGSQFVYSTGSGSVTGDAGVGYVHRF